MKDTALTLVSSPDFAVKQGEVQKLKEVAVAQLSAIEQMQNRAAMGAVIAGLTLHRVKASLRHGEFRKWIEQMSTTGGHLVKKSMCNYYMKLSLVFLEKARVQKPDLLALPGDQLILDVGDGHEGKVFFEKLGKFVGDCTLNELFEKHGVKEAGKRGGARERGAKDVSAEVVSPEEAGRRVREDLGEWVLRGRQMLLTDNVCAVLSDGELRAFGESLGALWNEFRGAMRGRKG